MTSKELNKITKLQLKILKETIEDDIKSLQEVNNIISKRRMLTSLRIYQERTQRIINIIEQEE